MSLSRSQIWLKTARAALNTKSPKGRPRFTGGRGPDASEAMTIVDGGGIAGPLEFPISDAEHAKSQSMEARIQAALAGEPGRVIVTP